MVIHLFLLGLELLLVWQVLPLASSAHSEMLAERSLAYLTIFYKAYNLRLAVAVLLFLHLQVNHVSRHTEWHKHHHVTHANE